MKLYIVETYDWYEYQGLDSAHLTKEAAEERCNKLKEEGSGLTGKIVELELPTAG